jgi:hypothetical protein
VDVGHRPNHVKSLVSISYYSALFSFSFMFSFINYTNHRNFKPSYNLTIFNSFCFKGLFKPLMLYMRNFIAMYVVGENPLSIIMLFSLSPIFIFLLSLVDRSFSSTSKNVVGFPSVNSSIVSSNPIASKEFDTRTPPDFLFAIAEGLLMIRSVNLLNLIVFFFSILL